MKTKVTQSRNLTPAIARAVGWDAANRRAKKAGRAVWNRDDYNEACRITNDLMRACGLPTS